MKKFPIVLDLETKYTFREYEKAKDLGVTVVGIFDYKTNKPYVFEEKELNKLFVMLENASYVIGFNNESFDMQVLQAYYPGDITAFTVCDLCSEVKRLLGRRLSLNDLASATLNKKKSGHGLMAIELYKQGRWDELKKYCMDDVMITKELFDYGAKHGTINYLSEKGKEEIRVDWKKYLEDANDQDMALTLPF